MWWVDRFVVCRKRSTVVTDIRLMDWKIWCRNKNYSSSTQPILPSLFPQRSSQFFLSILQQSLTCAKNRNGRVIRTTFITQRYYVLPLSVGGENPVPILNNRWTNKKLFYRQGCLKSFKSTPVSFIFLFFSTTPARRFSLVCSTVISLQDQTDLPLCGGQQIVRLPLFCWQMYVFNGLE